MRPLSPRGPWLALALVLSSAARSPAARADEFGVCIAAAEESQRLRLAGKLVRAREQLLVCSRTPCPIIVRTDCARWSSELDAIVPSVIVRALDPEGNDVPDVQATVDDEPIAGLLGGKEVLVDPGAHVFRFTRGSGPSMAETVVVRPGEQHRPLSMVFGLPASGGAESPLQYDSRLPASGPPAQPGREAPSTRPDPLRPWFLAALGSGVLAIGTASYFWISGLEDHARLESTCGVSHSCSPSSVDSARSDLVIGDVVGLAGGSLAVVGLALLLFHHGARQPAATPTLQPMPGGGVLGIQGSL
jgi:hypothetical protein